MAEENYGIETQAGEVMDQEVQEVLASMSADQGLEKFRSEYEKLHRALKLSNENERRLLGKCRDLTNDISSNAQRVQQALKMTQDDQNTIQFLKQEVEKTYQLLQKSKDMEEKSKMKVENLRNEILNLHNMIQKNNQKSQEPKVSFHDMLNIRDQLKDETDLIQSQIENITNEKQFLEGKVEKQNQVKSQQESQLCQLSEIKGELEAQMKRDDEYKKKIHLQLEDIKKQYDSAKLDIIECQKNKLAHEKMHSELQSKINNKDRKILEEKKKNMEQNKKTIVLDQKIERLNEECFEMDGKQQNISNKILEIEINVQTAEDKKSHYQRANNRIISDIAEFKSQNEDASNLKDLTQQGINQLEDLIGKEKKVADVDRQALEELRRNRDLIRKEVDRSENNNNLQEEELEKKNKLDLEKQNEKAGLRKEIETIVNKTLQLEKENEKYSVQLCQANTKYFHALDEIKLKDNLISEFQKKNIETEAKLKQQQNLYEAVRSDRNLYSKNLTETSEEIQEIKRRYKIVNHQISQLKEEIDVKEIALGKEHYEHKKKDKIVDQQAKEMDKLNIDLNEKEKKLKIYDQEIKKLHFMIKESEHQKQKLKEEYELVVSERDILSTQLIRRNVEADLLYEKIKINGSTLQKGEKQYSERLGDIQILKQQIANLLVEVKEYKNSAANIDKLRREVHSLYVQNTSEQLKVKALSEELENPMNIHRWRKLDATDNESFEIMNKIATLQKRLIAKCEEVEIKCSQIKVKEDSLVDLKDIMKRQPSIEEEKMIPLYIDNLKQKNKQMSAMNQEMSVYSCHLNEYKLEIERLNRELTSTKKRFFEQKKKQHQRLTQSMSVNRSMSLQINMPNQRFAGGGFNLAMYNSAVYN